MNEQAWKEQAARVLCGADSCWDYDTLPEQRSEISATEDSFCKDYWRKLAAALYPIVQQAIAAERGEPVAWMYKSVFGTEICRFRWGADEGLTSDHWVGWAETPLYTLRTQIFGEASDGE